MDGITTKTDLCNLALGVINAKRINSYENDTSVEANACRLHLGLAVNSLLERHQWNFATVRANLGKLTAGPITEWDSAWQLPGNFVRLIRVVGAHRDFPVRTFAVEGNCLLTSGGEVASIVYVADDIPIVHWPALFIDAAKYKLAAEINGDISRDGNLTQSALQRLESLALPAAQTSDARQTASGENYGPRQAIAGSALCQVRRGGNFKNR